MDKNLRSRGQLGTNPEARTTNAFGTLRRKESGLGTTAASATDGCSINTLSSSNALIRYSEHLNTRQFGRHKLDVHRSPDG
jgi:hypothetical protein